MGKQHIPSGGTTTNKAADTGMDGANLSEGQTHGRWGESTADKWAGSIL